MRSAIKRAVAAAVSALTVIAFTAAPKTCDTSSLYSVSSAEEQPETAEFSDINEAAAYMKEKIRDRVTDVSVKLPYSFDDFQKAFDDLLTATFAETGVSDEGDYMRYGVHGYRLDYSGRSKYVIFNFKFDYFTTAAQERLVDEKIKSLISELDLNSKTEYEKIKAIYDYIVQNVKYSSAIQYAPDYSAYGALFNGNAVCQGISQLFYRLASESGISCRIIAGTSGGANHTWLIAAIDGLYYLLDPTWDITFRQSGKDHFFLKGTGDFDNVPQAPQHIKSSGKDSNYALYPDYTSRKFDMEYPVASKEYAFISDESRLKLGDVDLNRIIDARDATLVLIASTELNAKGKCHLSPVQMKNADINNDKKVDALDATRLLRYTVIVTNPKNNNIPIEEYVKKPF